MDISPLLRYSLCMTARVPTTSGRKKGLTNPKRGQAAIAGFDPFDHLLQRAIKATSVKVKDRIALELLPYCKPKLKAVEHKGDFNVTVTVTIGGSDT
jgi:hypothetical protein